MDPNGKTSISAKQILVKSMVKSACSMVNPNESNHNLSDQTYLVYPSEVGK